MATIRDLEKRIKKLEIRISREEKVSTRMLKLLLYKIDLEIERQRAYYQRLREEALRKEIEKEDKKILSKVKEVLKEGELGVEEIKEELKRKGFKVGDQRLRDILKDAVKAGILYAVKLVRERSFIAWNKD